MNTAYKSSNTKTNIIIILGLTLIFISLAWFGYCYLISSREAIDIAHTASEVSDQIQPNEDKMDNTEQPDEDMQSSNTSGVQNNNEE